MSISTHVSLYSFDSSVFLHFLTIQRYFRRHLSFEVDTWLKHNSDPHLVSWAIKINIWAIKLSYNIPSMSFSAPSPGESGGVLLLSGPAVAPRTRRSVRRRGVLRRGVWEGAGLGARVHSVCRQPILQTAAGGTAGLGKACFALHLQGKRRPPLTFVHLGWRHRWSTQSRRTPSRTPFTAGCEGPAALFVPVGDVNVSLQRWERTCSACNITADVVQGNCFWIKGTIYWRLWLFFSIRKKNHRWEL